MDRKYIVVIDQGTTSTRVFLYNSNKKVIGEAARDITQYYPEEGWVEHDPMEIYASALEVVEEVLRKSKVEAREIAGLGITNQRETTILFNKDTGLPVYNGIVWQCRRTVDICRSLKEKGLEDYIVDSTGLLVDPYFSGTKVAWILDEVEGVRQLAGKGKLGFSTVDSWLLYKLSGDSIHLTDYTNASRTMLFNIKSLKWDDKILDALNIPAAILPSVRESSGEFGEALLFGEKVPVVAMVGDQQSALFGQGCLEVGDCKVTYGTGAFLLINTGDNILRSKDGLLSTIGVSYKGKVSYAVEGSVFIAGALMKWMKEDLGLIADYEEIESLAREVEDSLGIVIVPALSGLGAPYWDSKARGSIYGLTRGSRREHILRAGLESVALQVYDLIESVKKNIDFTLRKVKVDGGMANNSLLLEIQSGLLESSISKFSNSELTAFGAYCLAGLHLGFFPEHMDIFYEERDLEVVDFRYEDNVREELIKGWKRGIEATLSWSGNC